MGTRSRTSIRVLIVLAGVACLAFASVAYAARLKGTDSADTIIGTTKKDTIDAKGGLDTVVGLSGNDVIKGGRGGDSIQGDAVCPDNFANTNVLSSGTTLDIADCNQTVGSGRDVLHGDSGDDVIAGGASADKISGGTGVDNLTGGPGKDKISGGRGTDAIFGSSGADRISARDRTRDTIECGSGRDTVIADRVDATSDCEVVRAK